jgi:hypothetical protein
MKYQSKWKLKFFNRRSQTSWHQKNSQQIDPSIAKKQIKKKEKKVSQVYPIF